jgi:hypothetical protein
VSVARRLGTELDERGLRGASHKSIILHFVCSDRPHEAAAHKHSGSLLSRKNQMIIGVNDHLAFAVENAI